MSAELRGILEAYTAVYDDGVKETLNSIHDEITEMNLSLIADSELSEIAEAALQELFEEGYSLFGAEVIFEDLISEAKVTYGSDTQSPRAQKIGRIKGAMRGAMGRAKETAATGAVKAYGAYRKAKQSVDDKAKRAGQTARNMSAQTSRKASEAKATVKSGLKGMIRKAADRVASGASKVAKRMSEGYGPGSVDPKLTTDRNMFNIKKSEQDAARERLLAKTKAKMKKEEVSKIRKDWGDAYASIYEKKHMDPVGKEDGDIDNDGDKDSSDDYLMNRRKAIGKSMGKKGKCENCGGKGCEKCEGMKEEVDQVNEDSRRMSNKQHTQRVRSNIKSFGSNYTPPKNYDPDANRGKGEVLTPKQMEKKRRKALRQEELEAIEEDSRRMSNKQNTQRVRSNIKSFGSNYTPPKNYDPDANRGQGEVLTAKQIEKKRRKALRKEEVTFSEAELEAIQAKVDSWED